MDFQPAWITDELNTALGRITGHNARKKRQTVLRLAEVRATGGLDSDVFEMPECCSKPTWYGRHIDGVHLDGWVHDPDIQAALEAAEARAHWWQDTAEARRIAKRQEKLAEARDLLAEYSPMAVQRLFVLMGQAGNEETRRRAANDILDRADTATATKTVATETGDHEQRVKLDLSDLPAEILQVLAGFGPEGDAGGGGQGRTE